MKLTITIDLPDSTIPDMSAQLDALNQELASIFAVDTVQLTDGVKQSPIERLLSVLQNAPAVLANREENKQRQQLIEAYIQSEARAHAGHIIARRADQMREEIKGILAAVDRQTSRYLPSSMQQVHRQNLAPHIPVSTLDSISQQVREQVNTAIENALHEAKG